MRRILPYVIGSYESSGMPIIYYIGGNQKANRLIILRT